MSEHEHVGLCRKLERDIRLTGSLEQDLTAHVDYYFECVRAHAHAMSAVQEAEARLSNLEAELSEAFRARAANSGEKLTVDGCASRVRGAETYQEAQRDVLALKRASLELLAFKQAFEARGHVLRDLTALATRGVNPQGIADYTSMRQRSAEQRAGATARTPVKK